MQVAVCEDDTVFVVAAHARGVVFDEDIENFRGRGATGDGIASCDEVVGFGVEGDSSEEGFY